MTNADKFKQIFGLYATELWSKTEGEFLAWLNSDFSQSDVPDMNVGDMVSRQAAIDAVHKNYDSILDFKSDGHTVADSFEDIINVLPSAQPELCEDAISRSEAIKVIEAVPDGNWKSIRYSKEILRLPSAEPEIIKCKDCKWWGREDVFKDGSSVIICKKGLSANPEGFCHYAERRTDE